MLALRPLIALFTALTLLVALPVAGAEAKQSSKKPAAQSKAGKKKRKNKKRKNKKRPKPATPAAASSAIGTITAIDEDLVTVTLTRGGSITAEVTDATEGTCETVPDEDDDTGEDEDIIDFLTGDDDPDEGEEGDPDTRSQRLDTCAPAVGESVYALTVDEGEYDVLDRTA